MFHGRENVLRPRFQNRSVTGRVGIALHEIGMAMGFLHANDGRRATTETFQTKGAGARKEFQHPRAFHPRTERVENRLFDQVGSGTDIEPLRNF